VLSATSDNQRNNSLRKTTHSILYCYEPTESYLITLDNGTTRSHLNELAPPWTFRRVASRSAIFSHAVAPASSRARGGRPTKSPTLDHPKPLSASESLHAFDHGTSSAGVPQNFDSSSRCFPRLACPVRYLCSILHGGHNDVASPTHVSHRRLLVHWERAVTGTIGTIGVREVLDGGIVHLTV
jgi:hypothetical protein